MSSSTFSIGQTVRYGNTGTVGKIVSFIEENGETFAEIENTDLYYRIDQLTLISEVVRKTEVKRDAKKDFEREMESMRDMKENAWQNTDQSCEGGG